LRVFSNTECPIDNMRKAMSWQFVTEIKGVWRSLCKRET